MGTSIGHREETRSGVLLLEVLIGKLLTVNGLATSALPDVSATSMYQLFPNAHITTGEVTSLQHELRMIRWNLLPL